MINSLEEFGTSSGGRVNTPSPQRPKKSLEDIINESASNDDDKPNQMAYTQWTATSHNDYIAVPTTHQKLVPGLYSVSIRNGIAVFSKQVVHVDKLMKFPDSVSDKILKEIESFWTRGQIFQEYGFLHRRGYLLYGPAGSGKTAIVQQVMAELIKNQGIVFICDRPDVLSFGLQTFRGIEPDRPVVCLFEDIDAIIKHCGEDSLLSLLDGENQINKVLNIATTNYPEDLDKRIVARPRRFDRVVKIGMPKAEIRKAYFTEKLNIKAEELDEWVAATENFSFAACAELVISVKCLGNGFKESVELLRGLMNNKVSSKEFEEDVSGPFGFAARK